MKVFIFSKISILRLILINQNLFKILFECIISVHSRFFFKTTLIVSFRVVITDLDCRNVEITTAQTGFDKHSLHVGQFLALALAVLTVRADHGWHGLLLESIHSSIGCLFALMRR